MSTAIDYKKVVINLTKELSQNKLRQLIDFAQFLKTKKEGFTYTEVKDSAEYVKKIRVENAKKIKSGRKFIKELVEWQKLNS